jgi:hypothetical protein
VSSVASLVVWRAHRYGSTANSKLGSGKGLADKSMFYRFWMRGRDSAGTDASGWRSKDLYSLYRALNGTERVELEKFASDYDKLEDRMGKKYHIHFCEAGDNDCKKKFSYGRGQNFEDAFEGGCLNSIDHEKLRMLK